MLYFSVILTAWLQGNQGLVLLNSSNKINSTHVKKMVEAVPEWGYKLITC